MANLSFNFNKIKRTFFNVTMKDGTELRVKMPTKNTLGQIQTLDNLKNMEGVEIGDVIDTVAAVVADCLSNNLDRKKVTAEQIADEYDLEEMMAFIGAYTEKFIGGIKNDPN